MKSEEKKLKNREIMETLDAITMQMTHASVFADNKAAAQLMIWSDAIRDIQINLGCRGW